MTGCAPRPAGAGAHAATLALVQSPGPILAARTPRPGDDARRPSAEELERRERAARGLGKVRIVRSWETASENGSTGVFLDVYNAGTRPISGLVVDLYYEDGERTVATDQTCHLGVVIPAGRVARVGCYKRLAADPGRVVPRVVDVYWR